MVDKNADVPIGCISIENGQFAWETAEVRKACEEFSSILESKFGKAPGEKKKDNKDPKNSEKTPLIEETKKEGKAKNKKDIEKKDDKNYVILKDIDLLVNFIIKN